MINRNTKLRFIKQRAKAFTLIELLVVIAIIGILSTLAILAFTNSRAAARDSKRLNDLKAMANALELYYADNNGYPVSLTPGDPLEEGGVVYMNKVPNNPTPRTDGDCPDSDYTYTLTNSGQSYIISTCLGTPPDDFSSTNSTAVSYSPSGLFQCGQSIQDSRDNNTYKTVQIGSQCWMKENLAYLPAVSPSNTMNISDPHYYVYGYQGTDVQTAKTQPNSNYPIRGVLYNWIAANTACPEGWRLPSNQEFNDLEKYTIAVINSPNNQYACTISSGGWARCADSENPPGTPTGSVGGVKGAGKSLKKVGQGSSGTVGEGDDLVGFSVILSGEVGPTGVFQNIGQFHMWVLPESSAINGMTRGMNHSYSTVMRNTSWGKDRGFSVRCLKDF